MLHLQVVYISTKWCVLESNFTALVRKYNWMYTVHKFQTNKKMTKQGSDDNTIHVLNKHSRGHLDGRQACKLKGQKLSKVSLGKAWPTFSDLLPPRFYFAAPQILSCSCEIKSGSVLGMWLDQILSGFYVQIEECKKIHWSPNLSSPDVEWSAASDLLCN